MKCILLYFLVLYWWYLFFIVPSSWQEIHKVLWHFWKGSSGLGAWCFDEYVHLVWFVLNSMCSLCYLLKCTWIIIIIIILLFPFAFGFINLAYISICGVLYFVREPNEVFGYLDADYKRWEEDIEKWQSPILTDERLPEW